jgi:hypothetical protein
MISYSKLIQLRSQPSLATPGEVLQLLTELEKVKEKLKAWEDAALIPCNSCIGGFSGYGTGYDAVCDDCAGNAGYVGRLTPSELAKILERENDKKVHL